MHPPIRLRPRTVLLWASRHCVMTVLLVVVCNWAAAPVFGQEIDDGPPQQEENPPLDSPAPEPETAPVDEPLPPAEEPQTEEQTADPEVLRELSRRFYDRPRKDERQRTISWLGLRAFGMPLPETRVKKSGLEYVLKDQERFFHAGLMITDVEQRTGFGGELWRERYTVRAGVNAQNTLLGLHAAVGATEFYGAPVPPDMPSDDMFLTLGGELNLLLCQGHYLRTEWNHLEERQNERYGLEANLPLDPVRLSAGFDVIDHEQSAYDGEAWWVQAGVLFEEGIAAVRYARCQVPSNQIIYDDATQQFLGDGWSLSGEMLLSLKHAKVPYVVGFGAHWLSPHDRDGELGLSFRVGLGQW